MRRITFVLIILAAIFLGFYFYLQANYYPPILMYHHIDENMAQKSSIAVSPVIFAKQMDFIKRHNYRVVSLEELCRMIRRGDKLSHNLLVITSDDGYKNNLTAVEVLKKYNFPATIFIIINYIDKEGYLNKQDLDWISRESPINLGSHTLNHYNLGQLSVREQTEEILGSRLKAKQQFGLELKTLCYPFGAFNRETLNIAKESGYVCACATRCGFSREMNLYALRRIKITDHDLGIRLWGKLSGFYNLFRRLKQPF
jgi:peptidoglycan/xylan/chitin deacetylase (PgdA/CDA1 family)